MPAARQTLAMDPLSAAQPAIGPNVSPVALVVDDDVAARTAIVRLLKANGFHVRTAQNGLEGFESIARADFHVIISDIRMPGLGGIAFYQQLEEVYPTFARRIIFVTAYSGSPDVLAFLKLTGQPYLQKPFDPTELLQAAKMIAGLPFFRRATMTDPGSPPP